MGGHKVDEPLQQGKYKDVLMYQVIGTDLNYTNYMFGKGYWSTQKIKNGLDMYDIKKVKMSFGKFKGKFLLEVIDSNPEYFDWLIEEGFTLGKLLVGVCDEITEEEVCLSILKGGKDD